METHTIPKSLRAEVLFWAQQPTDPETHKVRECDVHPIDARVIGVSKDNRIEVWNYHSHECVMSKTLSEIVSSIPHSKDASSPFNISIDQKPNNFIASRQSYSLRPSRSVYSTCHSNSRVLNPVPDASERTSGSPLKVGDVKVSSFCDMEAIRWNCGMYAAIGARATRTSLYDGEDSYVSDLSKLSTSSSTIHTSSCIMIVCETAILFHDYQTGHTSALVGTDLGAPKAIPTCAEFISPELCAIGCSDGLIRIWNCEQRKLVKTLNTGSKTALQALKNLLSKDSYSPNGLDCPLQEGQGRMRLLSVQTDGMSLIWESEILGNMILIDDEGASGQLTTSGTSSSFSIDEATDTLFTVSSDRSLRLWDLKSVGGSGTGKSTKDKKTRRNSFMFGQSSAKSKDEVLCIGKVKSAAGLPGGLARYTSFSLMQHPRFQARTFVVAGKTNTIGIVQMHEPSFEDQMSEKGSSKSHDGTTTLVLKTLQELSLAHLMAQYASDVLSGSDPTECNVSAREDVNAPKWVHSRSASVKVYTAQPHPLNAEVLVAATSVGLVILRIGSSESRCQKYSVHMHGALSPQEEDNTDNDTMSEAEEAKRLSGASHSPIKQSSLRASTMGSSNRRLGSVLGSTSGSSAWPYGSPVVSLNPMEELKVTGHDTNSGGLKTLKKALALPQSAPNVMSCRPNFYPSPSGAFCAIWWPESLYYIVVEVMSQDRKQMREVDRGQCYSVAWTSYAGEKAEIIDSNEDIPTDQTEEQNSAEETNEVEEKTTSEQIVKQAIDICVFITPQKEVASGKKAKSFFSSKQKDPKGGSVLPSMILMKDFHSVENVTKPTEIVTPTGCPDGFEGVFGGGPLLCITSKVSATEDKSTMAVSQIELDAAAAQEETDKPPHAPSGAHDLVEIPSIKTYKSQFYYVSVDELSEKKSVADKFVLTPFGPVMSEVSTVAWDAPQTIQFTESGPEVYTQAVAVLIKCRVNVLLLKGISTASQRQARRRANSKYQKQSSMSLLFSAAPVLDKVSLHCIATCQVGVSPYLIPTSLHWENGSLFATTPNAVFGIFSLNQPAKRSDVNDDSGEDTDRNAHQKDRESVFYNCYEDSSASGHLIQWGGSMADVLQVASIPCRSLRSYGHREYVLEADKNNLVLPHVLPMPYGHVEVVGIHRGMLLLGCRDMTIVPIPLTSSPMVAIAMLLQNWSRSLVTLESAGEEPPLHTEEVARRALNWAQLLPAASQDFALSFIAKRLAVEVPSRDKVEVSDASAPIGYFNSPTCHLVPFLRQLKDKTFAMKHVSGKTIVEVVMLQVRALSSALENLEEVGETGLSMDDEAAIAKEGFETIVDLLAQLSHSWTALDRSISSAVGGVAIGPGNLETLATNTLDSFIHLFAFLGHQLKSDEKRRQEVKIMMLSMAEKLCSDRLALCSRLVHLLDEEAPSSAKVGMLRTLYPYPDLLRADPSDVETDLKTAAASSLLWISQ